MSRIRIVGGTITKTTVGDHNIYSEGNIVYNSGKAITETSDVGISYGEPKDAPMPMKIEATNFDISFELDKNEKTVVPFGILDFKKKEENQFFKFKLKVSGDGINQWQLDIKNEGGIFYTCYSATNELSEVVITSKSKKSGKSTIKEESKDEKSESFWPAGEYIICWDGFDNNEIYDSTKFNGKNLKAIITGIKNGQQRTAAVDFSTNYNQVQWTDVKIDKKKKRIDVTLRVNLTDGGTQGLSCSTYTTEKEESYETFTPTNSSDSLAGIKITTCDWDKIPNDAIKWNHKNMPIKSRTKTFNDLRDLALKGIDVYWSRTLAKTGNKGTLIDGEVWEILVNSKQDKNGMKAPEIIYFTNSENKTFNRSHNFEGFRELYYKAGYTYYSDWESSIKSSIIYNSKGWYFRKEKDVIDNFLETSAHEIGHQLLFEYGGRDHSYTHKKSSHWSWIIQDPIPGSKYPKVGEIDLMKYVDESVLPTDYYNRVIIAQEDLLGLIWLTKIKVI